MPPRPTRRPGGHPSPAAFTFKNFEPSDHLKKYARRRLEKLGRFVGKSALDMQVNLSVDKFRHKAEVQMAGDGFTLSAVEQSEDMYATIDLVLEKLDSQLRKQVEKQKDRRRSVQSEKVGKGIDVFTFSTMGEGEDRTIVGTDHFAPKPMHVDEAAMQLDLPGVPERRSGTREHHLPASQRRFRPYRSGRLGVIHEAFGVSSR